MSAAEVETRPAHGLPSSGPPGEGTLLSRDELGAAWRGLRDHEGTRAQAPDVIGFADRHLAFLESRPAPVRPVEAFPAPKGTGLRWLALLDPDVDARLRALVGGLAPRIEARLGPLVTGNRLDRGAGRGRPLRLEPWRRGRGRWRAVVRQVGRQAGALLLADVRDCYGKLRTEVIEESLLLLGCHPARVGALRGILDRVQQEAVRGLPTGPEPSGVLANLVLAQADAALQDEGFRPIRWVDDFLVPVRDEEHARRALERLCDALRSIGLELAAEKTRIVDRERSSGEGPAASLAASRSAPPSAEEAFRTLAEPPRPQSALRDLRCLVAVSRERWGGAEGELLLRAASDTRRPGLVRSWSWAALAGTDAESCLEAASALDQEPDPSVRRGIVIAAALAGTRAARRFLRHAARIREVAATARWGLRMS